jgi:hypothetical protein
MDNRTEPIKIIPEDFVLTPGDARNKILFTCVICLVFAFVFLIYCSQGRNPKPIVGIFFPAICLSYGVVNGFFARYPIALEIHPSSGELNVDYLNGFGVQKTDSIRLAGAYI